ALPRDDLDTAIQTIRFGGRPAEKRVDGEDPALVGVAIQAVAAGEVSARVEPRAAGVGDHAGVAVVFGSLGVGVTAVFHRPAEAAVLALDSDREGRIDQLLEADLEFVLVDPL